MGNLVATWFLVSYLMDGQSCRCIQRSWNYEMKNVIKNPCSLP